MGIAWSKLELSYTVLYIWELDLNKNYDQVIKKIKQFAVQ